MKLCERIPKLQAIVELQKIGCPNISHVDFKNSPVLSPQRRAEGATDADMIAQDKLLILRDCHFPDAAT